MSEEFPKETPFEKLIMEAAANIVREEGLKLSNFLVEQLGVVPHSLRTIVGNSILAQAQQNLMVALAISGVPVDTILATVEECHKNLLQEFDDAIQENRIPVGALKDLFK